MCACTNITCLYNKVSLFTSGVTFGGYNVLGFRKFGACSAVPVGRLTLVEGGLVWRLVTKAFEVTFLCRLMRIYTLCKRHWSNCSYYNNICTPLGVCIIATEYHKLHIPINSLALREH